MLVYTIQLRGNTIHFFKLVNHVIRDLVHPDDYSCRYLSEAKEIPRNSLTKSSGKDLIKSGVRNLFPTASPRATRAFHPPQNKNPIFFSQKHGVLLSCIMGYPFEASVSFFEAGLIFLKY